MEGPKRPLNQLYIGPHKVLERISGSFHRWWNSRCINATIDRLKPAYLVSQDPKNTISTSSTTTSTSMKVPTSSEPKTSSATKQKILRFKE